MKRHILKPVYTCILLLAFSCTKDKTLTPNQLILGKWAFEKYGEQNPIGAIEKLTNNPAGYYFEFNKDGKITVAMNAVLSANWNLDTDGKILQIDAFGDRDLTVTTLTTKSLIFYDDKQENGQTKRGIYYLKKP